MANTTFPNFKYLLYKRSTSSKRIASMHSNDMINVKARFETLYRVNLLDKVIKDGETCALADILSKNWINGNQLFLAAEQGSGKGKNNVLVVLN